MVHEDGALWIAASKSVALERCAYIYSTEPMLATGLARWKPAGMTKAGGHLPVRICTASDDPVVQ